MIKITQFTKILFSLLLFCNLVACGFHPAGENPLPEKLHVLHLQSGNPYGQFEANLKKALQMVGIAIIPDPKQAPVTLKILQTTLFTLPSSVGTSSQATIYSVTYEVKLTLLDSHGKLLVGPRDVTSTSTMIVNAQQQINSTNQLDILSQQLQQDVIRQIFGILNSEQVREAVENHSLKQIKKFHAKSQR